MKVGSLFSGIGGLEFGLERAGMEVVWQVEKDDYCRRVLAKHWPDVKRYEDVFDVGAHNLDPVDVICGGFPCQPVSVAGKQKRQEDDRWLWPEFARIIRELRPRVALMENVPGLLSGGMGDVLRDLTEIGYDAEWQCIPAAAFGAPHLRWRVFIVAYPHGERGRTEQILWPEREDSPKSRDDGKAGVVADTSGEGLERQGPRGPTRNRDWWATEPDVSRVATGVSSRVDRLRALGNAVVPQVAEYIGRRIMESR